MSKEHPCGKCTRIFSRGFDLRRHVESVHDGIRYRCRDCFKEFTRVSYLKHHERTGNCRLKIGDANIVSVIPLKDYKVSQEAESFATAFNPFSTKRSWSAANKQVSKGKPSHTIMRPTQLNSPPSKIKREIDTENLSESSIDSDSCCLVRLPPNQGQTHNMNTASTSTFVPLPDRTTLLYETAHNTDSVQADQHYIDLTTPDLSPRGSTPCLDEESRCSYNSESTIDYMRSISPNLSTNSWDSWAERLETSFLEMTEDTDDNASIISEWSSVRDAKWAPPTPIHNLV